MSLHEIDAELRGYESDLSAVGLRYPVLAREAAQARLLYDFAFANAVDAITHECVALEKKLTVQEKEAQAVRRCEKEMEGARLAEAELEGAKQYLRVMEACLSSCQTRSKLYMMEFSLSARQA